MEFSYHNPTAIEFGQGKIKEIANKIAKDKKEKLTLMGKEVFNMPQNYEMVIEAIEYMYQSIGVPTKLSAYKTDDKVIKNVTSSLEKHGMTALGENGNITLDKVSQILEMSMK